jgi:hypothetical protein
MKKQFYSHLIQIETIAMRLQYMDLSEEERTHLLGLIDSSLHHAVLDAVLSELSEKDKKRFLEHMTGNDHDKLWRFLNDKVDNIEDKIKQTAESLTKRLHEDIDEARKK